MGRFNQFSDDELYMLKRQAVESSFNIVMTGKYTDSQVAMHGNLLNEVIQEIEERERDKGVKSNG